MNSSEIQDLQLSLQGSQNYFASGQETLKTLVGPAAGGSRSPLLTHRTPVACNANSNLTVNPNIQLDGLCNFTSIPSNHPLRQQMDEVLLGQQSLLLARYADLIMNKKQDLAIQTPLASPSFSGFGSSTRPNNNYGKKTCSVTTSLTPSQEDVDFLSRMLLLSSGQVSSPFANLQQGRLTPPRFAKNETIIEREPPFPEKLHRLLRDVESWGRSDVISFVADDTFRIHDPVIFFHDVLPRYFRQTKLSSFKRQLKLYGFELVSKGPTIGGYRHKLFSRKDPLLCRDMKRVAIKGRQPGSSANANNEEDTPCRTRTTAKAST